MIDIQKYSVPEKISEARKWEILSFAQEAVVSAIQRRPASTSDEWSYAALPCTPSFPTCRDFFTKAIFITNIEHCCNKNQIRSTKQEGQVDIKILWWGESRKLSFSLIWPLSWLPANRKNLFLPRDFRGPQNISEHMLFSCWLISFFSGLSLALNKGGCDWHVSQTRYTPLVEVNQAIKAWSF